MCANSEYSGEIARIRLCSKYPFHMALEPAAVARSDARPPGMRTIAGSILTSDNILSWRLVMK